MKIHKYISVYWTYGLYDMSKKDFALSFNTVPVKTNDLLVFLTTTQDVNNVFLHLKSNSIIAMAPDVTMEI